MASRKAGGVNDTTADQSKSNAAANQAMHNRNILLEDGKQSPDKSNQQKRVIRQIFTLDSKKLKDLGIESNILSAMSKLNRKTNDGNKSTLPSAVHQRTTTNSNVTITSASLTENIEAEKDSFQKLNSLKTTQLSATAPQINLLNRNRKSIANNSTERCTKSNTDISRNKKVHVLSNVVLNDGKLVNLQQLSSAIKGKVIIKPSNVLIGKHGKLSTVATSVNSSNQNNLSSIKSNESVDESNKNNNLYLHVKRLLSKKQNVTVNAISNKQTVRENIAKTEPTPSTSQKLLTQNPIANRKDKSCAKSNKLHSNVIDTQISEPFLGFSIISEKEGGLFKEKLNRLLNIKNNKINLKRINQPIESQSESTVAASIKCSKSVREKEKFDEPSSTPVKPKPKPKLISPPSSPLTSKRSQSVNLRSNSSHTIPSRFSSDDTQNLVEVTQKSDKRYKKSSRFIGGLLNCTKTRFNSFETLLSDDNEEDSNEVNPNPESITHFDAEHIVKEECGQFNIPEPIETELLQSDENDPAANVEFYIEYFQEETTSEVTKLYECDIEAESSTNLDIEMKQNETEYTNTVRKASRKKPMIEYNAVEAILNIDKQKAAFSDNIKLTSETVDYRMVEGSSDTLDASRNIIDFDAMDEPEPQPTPVLVKRKRGRPSKSAKPVESEQQEGKKILVFFFLWKLMHTFSFHFQII